MCEKCELIDYKVANCWRPCYQPGQKIHLPTPGRIFNQDEFEAQQTIDTLRMALKSSQREASWLRHQVEAIRARKPASQNFEGTEL